jgi:peptidoglycan/LPS O-acetylase OafA/YrhL
MRGGAAASVVLFHCSAPLESGIALFLNGYGWLGVDVFFVISGFVIPLSLHGKDYNVRHFPNFMLRRLIRLEPPYLISIALGIALWHLSSLAPGFHGEPPSYSFPQLAAHLLYLVPLTDYAWLSPVYWSLAYEFVFYILVGLLFPVLMHRRIEWTVALAAAVLGAFFAYDGRVDFRILEFAVGILLMRYVVADRGRGLIGIWLAALLLSVFLLAGAVVGSVILAAAAAIFLFHGSSLGAWSAFVGGISYSLYLTHVPIGGRIVNLGQRFGEGAGYEMLLIGVAMAVSVAFAIVFAHLVEKPAMRISRGISIADPRVVATPTPLNR